MMFFELNCEDKKFLNTKSPDSNYQDFEVLNYKRLQCMTVYFFIEVFVYFKYNFSF